MEYLYDFLLFAAKAIVVVVALMAIAGYAASARMQRHYGHRKGHLEVSRLNAEFDDFESTLRMAAGAVSQKGMRQAKKQRKRDEKQKDKERGESTDPRRRMYVIDFEGDISASRVSRLRREITALLTGLTEEDEVVVRLESAGGTVHGYGLAASQLKRVRDSGAKLVIAVDKVAASGGYLMAAVATHLIAAPFAVLGSIGVVVEMPNLNRLLKKHDVDYEMITAGKHKRTLTLLGENKPEHRRKVQQEIDDVHALFGQFLTENRPQVPVDEVSSGETWFGTRALDLKLVDELVTSDEYLLRARAEADIFEVKWVDDRTPFARFMEQIGQASSSFFARFNSQ